MAPYHRGLVLATFVLFLSACASGTTPVRSSANVGGPSYIVGHAERRGLADWQNFRVVSVDGKTVSYILSSPTSKKIALAEGNRKFVVFSEFNRSFSDPCPCQAFGELELEVSANTAYKLTGEIDGAKISFWIEDQSGAVVAGPASYGISTSPRDVIMPIFVN